MTRLPQLLFGRGVYAPVHHILEELPFERVGERPASLPHSIYEELWHLEFWQRVLLERARGEPESAIDDDADWPEGPAPANTGEWSDLLERLRVGLDEAAGMAADSETIDAETTETSANEQTGVRSVIEDIVAHNAYHFGRVVALRQILGLWPPHGIG